MQTSRYYLKHTAEPFVYAVEADDEGTLLNALDVSDEHEQGGLCPHMPQVAAVFIWAYREVVTIWR